MFISAVSLDILTWESMDIDSLLEAAISGTATWIKKELKKIIVRRRVGNQEKENKRWEWIEGSKKRLKVEWTKQENRKGRKLAEVELCMCLR